MKKLVSTLLALSCFALVFALSGCSNDDGFTEKIYVSGNTEIEAVRVDVQDREITVLASDDNQISVEYCENEKEYYEIAVSQNKELSIKLQENKSWTDFLGFKPSLKNRKILLKLPVKLFTQITIVTSNENINLSSQISAEIVSLSSNDGNIDFAPISIKKALNLTAKNGNIQGTVLGSYDDFSIHCTIKKGDCNLPLEKAGGEKKLTVNCNNGNTAVNFVKP